MRIDVVESISDLENIRSDWDRVYMSDPHAQYFLSWTWLHSHLLRRGRWFVLALRESEPASPYVAFLPLRIVTHHDPKSGLYTDEIVMAGNPAVDYAGIIAEPIYEQRAIEGFSLYLRDQNWTTLQLSYLCGPIERRDAILQALSGAEVDIRILSRIDENNIDQAVSPHVELPDSWESYLEERLGGQTRRKIRRFLKQVEGDDAFRISVASAETVDTDLDALFALWRIKWSKYKGDRTDAIIAAARVMLMDAFIAGDLFLAVLRHEGRPLGAIANLRDPQKKALLVYITGRDEAWQNPSPGLILHGYAIRQAIAWGYRTYDFLRGNEAYKYTFGAEDRPLHCAVVRTKTGRNLRDRLNVRSVDYVFKCAKEHYKKGEKPMAEVAFQQVIATNPDHQGARFGLARLLYDKGRLAEAETAFKSIIEKVKDPLSVLPHLGDAQLALKKFVEAASTFALIAELQPNSCEALYKQGVALVAAQQKKKAIKIFQNLDALNSDNPGHVDLRIKARDVLAKLLPSAQPPLKLPAIHPSGCPLAKPDIPTAIGQVMEQRQPSSSAAAIGTSLSTSRLASELPFVRQSGSASSNWRTKH